MPFTVLFHFYFIVTTREEINIDYFLKQVKSKYMFQMFAVFVVFLVLGRPIILFPFRLILSWG